LAGLAVLLGVGSMYTTLADLVRRRRREIAIRMSLGGAPLAVAKDLLGWPIIVCMLSAAIGIVLAAVLYPTFSAYARDVNPWDATTIAVVAVVLVGTQATVAAISAYRVM